MMNLLSSPVTGILFAALLATTTTAQVDLNFKGGTMRDYVGAARTAIEAQSAYEKPNVLIKGPADQVMMPELTLRSVHPRDAIQLIERYQTDTHVIQVSRMQYMQDEKARPVVVVEVLSMVKEAPKRPSAEPTATQVISVRDLVELPLNLQGSQDADTLVVKIETLLNAMDVAFGLEEGKAPTLKFHEESALLFIRGTGMQLAVADDVIRKLQKPLDSRRSMALGKLASEQRAKAQKSKSASGR